LTKNKEVEQRSGTKSSKVAFRTIDQGTMDYMTGIIHYSAKLQIITRRAGGSLPEINSKSDRERFFSSIQLGFSRAKST
jgi:hypothetical protein